MTDKEQTPFEKFEKVAKKVIQTPKAKVLAREKKRKRRKSRAK